MALCGESIEPGVASLWGDLDQALVPLQWLASLRSCAVTAELVCENERCASHGTVLSVPIDDGELRVDVAGFVAHHERALATLDGKAIVSAAVNERMVEILTQPRTPHPCRDPGQRVTRRQVRECTYGLVGASGRLPPLVIANYDTILGPGAARDFFDALDPEETIEIAAGQLRGFYRLTGLIGHMGGSHFVAQFLHAGNAYYQDAMDHAGEAFVVGTRINPEHLRGSHRIRHGAAIYVLQESTHAKA
jgi:hypothetical protein